ncbi:MAG: aminopeptidase P family protein [Sutterellaceae bacterium]|nr:aminopeptidase P family protein [Sutterellaceae bacterium]MDD7441832.1 aminopeptidase family protein P [Sutterellaceae bacterium]MDY2867682.1 aminopeptidase P family protein [Mesosutterella sp.]
MSDTRKSIGTIRSLMKAEGIDCWITLPSDPHASEYVPAHWAALAWASGFSGDNGVLVVTGSEARLWTDSRYWVQAANELRGSGISLMKDGAPGVPSWEEWTASALKPGSTAALDGRCLSVRSGERAERIFRFHGVGLRTDIDIIGRAWKEGRPAVPSSAAYRNTAAPESPHEKILRLRSELEREGADSFITSSLDEPCWITNLRGSDVPYNPVFLSHFILTPQEAVLFTDSSRLSDEIRAFLGSEGIQVRPYEDFARAVSGLPAGSSLLIDPATTSVSTRNLVPSTVRTIEGLSPVALLKTRKTQAELRLIDEAMVEDGAALCRFYAWLEKALAAREPLTEMDVVRKLHDERAKGKDYVSESFGTIAAVGPNAALPHYEPSESSCAPLSGDTILLIDSGAQYQTGTTDITRVTRIHNPPEALKRDYTAVLRAHLALLDAYFPEGAYASQLDTFARAPLWEVDADFGHGTGHGVGFFLNVHERPYSISPRSLPSEGTRTVEGIVVSDEPGLYRPGRWGIRIESLVTPVPQASSEFGRFMAFRPLTLCPIDTSLIVPRMMKSWEIAKLNEYHRHVREKLLPAVDGEAKNWLIRNTAVF